MFQNRDFISAAQFRRLIYLVMLPVTVRTMSSRLADTAGGAGWLAPLAAIPVTLLTVWMILRLISPRDGRWRGMAEVFCEVLGPVAGRILSLCYLAWLLVLASYVLRLYGERFLSSIYEHMTLAPFLVILLLVSAWILHGSFAALARVNQIFFVVLVVMLLAVLLLSLEGVELTMVLPVRGRDLLPVGRAAVSVLNVIALSFYTSFLAGGIRARDSGSMGRVMCCEGGFCLFAALFQFVVTGNYGAGLAGRIELPLFTLSKQIRILGAFQRMESISISLWIFTDLILLCTILFACCAILQKVCGMADGRSAGLPLVLLLLAGAYLIAGDAFALEAFARHFAQYVNAAMGLAVPILIFAIKVIRDRRRTKLPREERKKP
ncbi:MAG: GerAB/ArcD/ProY family transporter [Oscillospiraceae bacterium]|nr:GerAB/ArcD/ProY family transporter [Oscillospiraceae bacterium]